MDIPNELPLPEPSVPPQADPAQPILPIGSVSGDPLCRILDRLEASIEQPVPAMCPDPLCRTLDKLEASIEQQPPVFHSPKPLNEILDRLENETEHQTYTPKHKQDSQEEVAPFMQNDFPLVNRQFRHPFAPTQKPETYHRESSPLRQYPEPTHRMTGHRTGIRNSGNGFDWYCNVRQEWVSKDECNGCSDFEEPDYVDESEGDVRCRYSYSTFNEEQNNVEEKGYGESEDAE
jgi:hypothetical protein